MKVRKEWIGSKKPATQANLSDLQEDMHLDLQNVEERLGKRISRVERISESILKIVQSSEGRLREQKDLPEEVDKLKTRVFKLELRRSH